MLSQPHGPDLHSIHHGILLVCMAVWFTSVFPIKTVSSVKGRTKSVFCPPWYSPGFSAWHIAGAQKLFERLSEIINMVFAPQWFIGSLSATGLLSFLSDYISSLLKWLRTAFRWKAKIFSITWEALLKMSSSFPSNLLFSTSIIPYLTLCFQPYQISPSSFKATVSEPVFTLALCLECPSSPSFSPVLQQPGYGSPSQRPPFLCCACFGNFLLQLWSHQISHFTCPGPGMYSVSLCWVKEEVQSVLPMVGTSKLYWVLIMCQRLCWTLSINYYSHLSFTDEEIKA